MFAALALAAAIAAPSPCAASGTALKFYLETDAIGPRDSIARVRLCLGGATADARVNSLSARVVVDTAFGRVVDVERATAPSVVARADTTAGTVLVAGAASNGIADGSLVSVRVRLLRPGTLPKISVVLTEMNGPTGTSMVTRVTVAGLDAKCAGAQPALFEVLPPTMSADPAEPLDLRINGCGFSADRNTVKFGDVTVQNIKSSDGGTHIRVVIPKQTRATSEVAPMPLGAGEYDVTVNNGRGTSNAKRVTLR
jgi:hypothetical protein